MTKTQAEVSSLQRTLQLLPSSEENIARLQSVVSSSDAKMAKLQEQFKAHCTPLNEKIELLTKHLEAQESIQETLTAEIQDLRTKRLSLSQEAPRLEAQAQLLSDKLKSRSQTIGRSFYTKSILELTAKVHQQRQVTGALLQDIKRVQKEINSLSGKIDRSFTLIEEVSYKASWNHSVGTPLYRCVISIHEGCSSIVQIIRETGALKRQCAELKEQVIIEERREMAKALEKLQEDLAAVKLENQSMKAKLLGGK